MERCPTCKARCRLESACHRCGMDLERLRAVQRASAKHAAQARRDFANRDFEAMFVNARRAQSLYQTDTGHLLLAVAALTTHRYPLTLDLWQRRRH